MKFVSPSTCGSQTVLSCASRATTSQWEKIKPVGLRRPLHETQYDSCRHETYTVLFTWPLTWIVHHSIEDMTWNINDNNPILSDVIYVDEEENENDDVICRWECDFMVTWQCISCSEFHVRRSFVPAWVSYRVSYKGALEAIDFGRFVGLSQWSSMIFSFGDLQWFSLSVIFNDLQRL